MAEEPMKVKHVNKDRKLGLVTIGVTMAIMIACAASEVFVRTNYEVDQPLIASVGEEMVVIEKVRANSTGNIALQALSSDDEIIGTINFVATLTYTGKSGSNIKVAYREFSGVNDRTGARPAFYLNLEYALEDKGSTTITYRDIQIEIIEATSSNVQFKVISDNGLTWLPEID